jgi:trimeric autotransporter adhesin
MTPRSRKNTTTASLSPLVTALSFILCAASPSEAQCTDATATRPILFVPGFNENSTAWGGSGGIRGNVVQSLAGTPGYSSANAQMEYDLYFDGTNVRLAQAAGDDLSPGPVASSENVPCDARNFAISFYGWATNVLAFDPLTVDQVSIITKAYELSQVLKAISSLTYVQDVIVIAHSMGALDARAYVEELGSTYPGACTNASQPCPLPGSLAYTGEVGHLITLDGANAGGDYTNLASWLLGFLGGSQILNVNELNPQSAIVQALKYHQSYDSDQAGPPYYGWAQPIPPSLAIDAIISYYSPGFVECTLSSTISCFWDAVVTSDSQSIVDPLGAGTGLADFPNSFAPTDPSIVSDPNCMIWVDGVLPVADGILHLLPCLGDYHSSAQVQTGDLVYQRVSPYLVGQLTTVNITTYNNGQPYQGSIVLALQTPNASVSITSPQWTLRGAQVPPSVQVPQVPPLSPAPYTLSYVSGGPAGAGAPSIQGRNANGGLCGGLYPPCYLQPGNWALTFSVTFTSGTISPPSVATQAPSAVSGDGATLLGTANPNGANTTAWFEWGPTSGYGNSTPAQGLGSGTATQSISFALGGLESNTTCYYRLDASNGTTTVLGNMQNFTTLGTLPSPTLFTPGNSSTNVTTAPTFTWSAVGPPTSSYRLLIATNSAALPTDPTSLACGVGCVLDVTPVGTTYTPPPGVLQAATEYYWEAHARSPLQFGNWSGIFNFATSGPSLASTTISPTTITSGASATVSVTLNGPAPTGGAQVTLTSSNSAAFPVPSSLLITAGNTTASLSVTSGSVSTSTAVTVTATYAGSSANAAVTVAPSGGSVFLSSFTITPPSIPGGYATQGNVFLTGSAPATGAVVNLSSNNPSFVQVPSTNSITVQPGYTSAAFPISTSFTSSTVGATIQASYNNTMYGATVTVLPVVADGLTFYPSAVTAGSSAQFTVYLNGPAPAGASVSLVSSNPSALQVAGSAPVPAGATSVLVAATTLGIGSQTSVTVTATYNGGSAQGAVTIYPLSVIGFNLSPVEVTGGSNVTGTVAISGPAPSGGVNISLSSSSTLVQVPSSVNIPQGSSSASFTATTSGVSSVNNVTLTVSYSGTSYSDPLTVVPPLPYLASLNFSPATVNSGSAATGTVTLTSPAPLGGIAVSLTSSFYAVANVTNAVVVQQGATTATFNVPTSAIGFIAPVTISASYNGTTQTGIVTVVPAGTPLAPSSLTLAPYTVTGGSPSTATVTLTGPAPFSGAMLSVSSDNPAVQVTPLLSVAAGLNTAAIQVTTSSVSAISTATIRVTYNGISQSSLLTIEPSGGQPSANPVPLLTAPLSPVSQPPGGNGHSLTVNGTGFASGAQAYWNGTAIPTTYVSRSQLQASVPASDVQTNGSAVVTVRNAGSLNAPSNGLAEYTTFPTSSPSFSTIGLTSSGQPGDVVAADLNGDGKVDLVVASSYVDALSVFLGNGDGTFGSELLLPSISIGSAVVVADFNGDGKPDIVTVENSSTGGAIRLFLGNGDGTFTSTADSPFYTGSISNTSLAVGDFNGDGKLDVVVIAEEGPSQAYVLLGNGDGTFGPAAAFGSVSQPFGVAVGDFNGDGKLDLALTDTANSAVAVLFGNGDGTFQSQVEYATNGYPYALVVADFNGDGYSDIAVANGGPTGGNGGGTAVLLNNGNGTFAPPVNYAQGSKDYFLSTDDVNGDGKIDLIVSETYPSPQTLIFLGNGDGTFNASPLAQPTGSSVYYNAVADLNGDGAPDIVTTNFNGGAGDISILLQTVAPVLQVAPTSLSYTVVQGSGSPSPLSITISNTGTGAATWTATTSQSWLSLGQTSGTAPATVTVSVNPSGLNTGTYNATITVSATGASNSPQGVAITLIVNPAPVVISSLTFNPATLTGPGTSAGTVTLSGPAPAGGATVALSSNNSVVQVPAAVTVTTGLTSANFTATASAASSQTVVTVTATYNGGATTASLTLQPGAPAVTLSPASLNLGSVVVGSASAKKTVKLTNSGTSSLSGKVTASGDYAQSSNCPVSLAPGVACEIAVTFTPTVAGSVPGALTIADNAANSPQLVNLAGVGVYVVSAVPSSVAFGTDTVGVTSPAKTITLTNNSTSSVGFSFAASADFAASASGSQPCGANLAAGANCTVAVTFTPSQNGSVSGTLAVSGASFATQLVTLTGSGSGGSASPFTFSPSSVTFTSQQVGTSASARTVTVTNSSVASVNIVSVTASADFGATGSGSKPCGGRLAVNAKCTMSVTFTPSVAGSIKGSVALKINSSASPLIYDLAGTGVAPVTLSPTNLTFGAQNVGTTSSAQTVTITNNQAVALNSLSLTGSGNYTVFSGGTAPCATSVAAHATCTFEITFTPTNTGTIQGAATITDDASGSPQIEKLTGTGQ